MDGSTNRPTFFPLFHVLYLLLFQHIGSLQGDSDRTAVAVGCIVGRVGGVVDCVGAD
jgi:hypothetical protein